MFRAPSLALRALPAWQGLSCGIRLRLALPCRLPPLVAGNSSPPELRPRRAVARVQQSLAVGKTAGGAARRLVRLWRHHAGAAGPRAVPVLRAGHARLRLPAAAACG